MTRTALIAESNKIYLDALAYILSTLGFNVVEKTSDQSKIVSLAKEFSPDLMVLDHDMSSNGMAKELKEQLPEMKILVLGYQEAVEEFMDELLKAGFDGFWNKYDNRDGFLKSLEAIFP